MSERTSFQITLPWATQEDVDDFFAPPTKPVKPELHRLGWFVFQSGVFRWDGGGGVVVLGH